MTIATNIDLNRMARITKDYGRMLNRSTGLCSLWTGLCLGGLTVLTFTWTWDHYLALGRPEGNYLLFLLRTREALPVWILATAFCLPFLWAVVMRAFGSLVYPERFGTVGAQPPEWLKGLEPLAGPLTRWSPFRLLTGMAVAFGILIPLFGRAMGNPREILWRAFLAPLLGLLWAWLMPRLRQAEASEGTMLVYIAGFLLVGRELSIMVFCFPMYLMGTLAIVAYGIWAHVRYRQAVAILEATAPEAADV